MFFLLLRGRSGGRSIVLRRKFHQLWDVIQIFRLLATAFLLLLLLSATFFFAGILLGSLGLFLDVLRISNRLFGFASPFFGLLLQLEKIGGWFLAASGCLSSRLVQVGNGGSSELGRGSGLGKGSGPSCGGRSGHFGPLAAVAGAFGVAVVAVAVEALAVVEVQAGAFANAAAAVLGLASHGLSSTRATGTMAAAAQGRSSS